jgi:hypothetical protein
VQTCGSPEYSLAMSSSAAANGVEVSVISPDWFHSSIMFQMFRGSTIVDPMSEPDMCPSGHDRQTPVSRKRIDVRTRNRVICIFSSWIFGWVVIDSELKSQLTIEADYDRITLKHL